MLKIYNVESFVSVNGGKWEHVGRDGQNMFDGVPSDEIVLDGVSFEECYNYLKEHRLDGIYICNTFFRKIPRIFVQTDYSWNEGVFYRNFDSISYKYTYKESKYTTLEDIMKHYPADKCIQYMKERGITACPILNNQ